MAHLRNSVLVMLVCIQAAFHFQAALAQRDSDEEGPCDQEGAVRVVEAGSCAKRYRLCANRVWVDAMCVGGKINASLHQCHPSGLECPEDRMLRGLLSRKKRQTNFGTDCKLTYSCPSTVKELFIYPDWSNPKCDTFIMCLNGQSVLASCKSYGFDYYNPRRLSCESVPTSTNTCVFRLRTDLSPIQ